MKYPSDPVVGLVAGKFTDGDPVGGVPASLDRAAEMNAVYDELLALISGSGQTPDEVDLAQVLKAVKRLAGAYVKTVDANTVLTVDDAGLIIVDATAGNITITLESAAAMRGHFEFRRKDATANTVTIQRAGADTIEGATSIALNIKGRVKVVSDGASVYHRTVLQIATAAEAQAFSAEKLIDGAALAAAFQGANQLNAAGGYQKLPGGVIIQWGMATQAAESAGTVTLPMTFPNNFWMVNATLKGTAAQGNATASAYASPINNSSFTIVNDQYVASPSNNIYWLALGN